MRGNCGYISQAFDCLCMSQAYFITSVGHLSVHIRQACHLHLTKVCHCFTSGSHVNILEPVSDVIVFASVRYCYVYIEEGCDHLHIRQACNYLALVKHVITFISVRHHCCFPMHHCLHLNLTSLSLHQADIFISSRDFLGLQMVMPYIVYTSEKEVIFTSGENATF